MPTIESMKKGEVPGGGNDQIVFKEVRHDWKSGRNVVKREDREVL